MYASICLKPYRGGGVTAYNTPAFKAQQEALREHDQVEISTKQTTKNKKGLSKGAKWALGITGGLATIIGGFALACKGRANQLQKLYTEKLVLSNFPEKITFVEAKTAQEGIDFARNILKIKEVSSDFTVDAINFANKGLVDVINANNGKCFMPTKLIFAEMDDYVSASANKAVERKTFGTLKINKKYFDNDFLTKYLKEHIPGLDKASKRSQEVAKKEAEEIAKNKYTAQDLLGIKWDETFKDLVRKFRNEPEKMSIPEKRTLTLIYDATNKKFNQNWHVYPDKFIENNLKLFTEQGIEVNIDEIKKLSNIEQTVKLFDLLKQRLEKTGENIVIKSVNEAPEKTIYHEMGHFQDYAKNLEKLDVGSWKFWKKGNKLHGVGNHWGGMTYDGYLELFKKDEKLFKEMYPDLHEHWTNINIQKTAGKISDYARTGIGEFIADTYAELIKGTKLPDDVMALYKKYNGPIPGTL